MKHRKDCGWGGGPCDCLERDNFDRLERAEADLKEAVALLRSQHHCYRVELGSPSVVCIPCDFLARISAEVKP